MPKPTPVTAAPDVPSDLPIVQPRSRAAWARWLEEHHASSRGVWLRMSKKGAATITITYPEALEEALCYGWIDGQARGFDDESYFQRFTPRGKRSIWSKVNRTKVDALTAAGRMKPAGLAAVEAARADGRWDAAYDSQRDATVPEDLQAALDRNPKAKKFFATLTSQNRYAVLFRVQTAKRAETRAKRITDFVAMLARGETLHP
jgi:uncharacterized protein YdeI (YjbR/CyaY-like superfamily)